MTVTKLQWAAGVLAACGVLTIGGVWATGQGPGLSPFGQPPAAGQPPVAAGAPADPLAGAPPAAPANDRQADSAQRRRSFNNLKQIMLAIHNYQDTYGHLPADLRDKDGKPLLSWRVAILPFLEQNNLYKQFKLDEPWDSEHNLKLLAHLPAVYRVGIEPKDATHTYYQAFAGPGTPLHPTLQGHWASVPAGGGGPAGPGGPGVPGGFPGGGAPVFAPPGGLPGGAAAPGVAPGGPGAGQVWEVGPHVRITDITDGTSNTLGVVEAGPPVPWTKPADLPFDPQKPPKVVGPFSNVLNAAMMDGSAHALKPNLPPDVLRTLIVMNDGQVTPPLNKFHVPLSADTPEAKEELRQRLDENAQLIREMNLLMGEYARLLLAKNRQIRDPDQAKEHAQEIKQYADWLRVMNKKLRDDLGLRPGAAVPPARDLKP